MLGIYRTTTTTPARAQARAPSEQPACSSSPRRAWSVEYLEGRTLLSQFSVTNLNDSGGGSLRQAIIDSNKTTGPNEIDFAAGLSGTITLTSGELTIANDDVSIVGPGQDLLSVSGNGNSRVFEVVPGVTASLSELTITRGRAGSPFSSLNGGGGIDNQGTMTIHACTISGNSAGFSYTTSAAAASTTSARLTIDACTISGNSNGGCGGGGIMNDGTITITHSTLSGNSSRTDDGGGILNRGAMTIIDSVMTGNSARLDYQGGAIANDGGALTITDSVITGNSASRGGAIVNSSHSAPHSRLTIARSIISGNTALGNSAGSSGGGIDNSGVLDISDCTFTGNVSEYGGGLNNGGGDGITATVASSLFRDNSAAFGGGIFVSGLMTVVDSTISKNSSISGTGGGIYNTGRLIVVSSDLSDNVSVSDGGGLTNELGDLSITNSTIRDNTANGDGGGIANTSFSLTITSSTVSDNHAGHLGGGIFNGHSIYNSYGRATINTTTLSENTSKEGGGIYSEINSTTVLSISIVAGNSATVGQGQDTTGGFRSLGYNLIGNTEASSGWVGTDLLNVEPEARSVARQRRARP